MRNDSMVQQETAQRTDPSEQFRIGGESFARVTDLVAEWAKALPPVGRYSSPSVSLGSGGYALFLSCASEFLGDPQLKDLAEQHLAYGVELINQAEPTASLYKSLPGTGWVMSHVLGRSADVDAFMVDAEILLAEGLESAPKNFAIDLVNGLAGLTVFATRSFEHTSNSRLLNVIADRFLERFDYWTTDPYREFPQGSPDGNLGMAHGIPGIVSVFAKAAERNLLSDEAVSLTSDGFSYLDRFLVETRGGDCYFANEQVLVEPARLAWCYGGLGAAFAYLRGQKLFDRSSERAEQLVGYATGQFGTTEARLHDATLCHGYAGTALQFDRIARNPAFSSELRSSARLVVCKSIDHVFQLSSVANGVTQFPARLPWGNRIGMSLLEGSVGVCLALMAIHSDVRPDWLDLLAI